MSETGIKAAAMIPLILAAALFFGAIVLSFVFIRRWRGLWRAAACLPVAALVAWAAFIAADVSIRPGSHNLWPLELVLWGAGALVALGLISLVRRLTISRKIPG